MGLTADSTTSESKRLRVLAVDDTSTALDVLSALLSAEGYEVLTASNGQQALALAAQTQPETPTKHLHAWKYAAVFDPSRPGAHGGSPRTAPARRPAPR